MAAAQSWCLSLAHAPEKDGSHDRANFNTDHSSRKGASRRPLAPQIIGGRRSIFCKRWRTEQKTANSYDRSSNHDAGGLLCASAAQARDVHGAPLQRLRLLRQRLLNFKSTASFHREMTSIFTSLRDLHTNYCLPAPFKDANAWLPFKIESYCGIHSGGDPPALPH